MISIGGSGDHAMMMTGNSNGRDVACKMDGQWSCCIS